MRVLYSFTNRLGVSSIGTTAWHQVVGLAEQGAEVTVVCPTSERPLPSNVRLVETLRLGGFKVPFRLIGHTRAYTRNDRYAAEVLARSTFDVVHCWPMGSERTLITARAVGVCSVLERPNAHTAFAFDAVEDVCAELGIPVDPSSPHARRSHKLAQELREYQLTDKLLCPSDFVMNTFLDAGFPADRILRHRYGYDPTRFNTNGRIDSSGPLTVCFVGNGEPRKGLHYALQAWLASGAADVGGQFLIAGAMEPAYKKVLTPLLNHRSVKLVGYVNEPEDLMRACDVLVLPSVEEGSSLVTYEAQACGCVLAVSDRTGSLGRNGIDALVHPAGDVAVLTRQFRELAEDRQLLESLRVEVWPALEA